MLEVLLESDLLRQGDILVSVDSLSLAGAAPEQVLLAMEGELGAVNPASPPHHVLELTPTYTEPEPEPLN